MIERVIDELHQIKRRCNEDLPPRNLDLRRTRDRLEGIEAAADRALLILEEQNGPRCKCGHQSGRHYPGVTAPRLCSVPGCPCEGFEEES